ncbi:adenosylcobinamide-GDP ribazoletransferase [Paenibacillus humicola]|uniref:adenosylcobinamide-GDP ribazoletransferase n=1 Tax=Paenibacillus humicola TaxID=3110540 RepID=UPI00237BB8F1|nr:adenosylcobinamide-GDP ribazoletransferase [Paenibacillus humicola]
MVFRAIKGQLQAAGAAFQLLSRVPIPFSLPFTPPVLARSAVYFPAVGALLGAVLAITGWVLGKGVPALPAAVLLLIVWTVYSGALHLDGLMDTADGVLSHRPRERMLEIMKDSRVGAMGVTAAALLLLFKFSLLAALLDGGRWAEAWPAVAAACMWSRLWLVFAMACWPFARPDEGLAAMFARVKLRHAAAALAVNVLLIAAVYAASGMPFAVSAASIAVQAAIAAGAGTAACGWLSRKLGGLTGDTYGAVNELLEALLLFAALWGIK